MLSPEQIEDIKDIYQQAFDDIQINYCTVEYGIDLEKATEGYNNVRDAFIKALLEAQEQATAREIFQWLKKRDIIPENISYHNMLVSLESWLNSKGIVIE